MYLRIAIQPQAIVTGVHIRVCVLFSVYTCVGFVSHLLPLSLTVIAPRLPILSTM